MTATAAKKKNTAIVILVMLLIAAAVLIAIWALDIDVSGKSRYPLEYEEQIVQYAQENGVDPYLVAAMVYVESGFDSQAVSSAGAMGLMQIMPETGEWIAGKFDMQDFNEEQLFDPETNIKFGSWYLGFLDERFGGDMQLVAAAYNAGHNRVDGWLEDVQVSEDGKSLTNIPYEETENYLKKVNKAYEKYKELYEIG